MALEGGIFFFGPQIRLKMFYSFLECVVLA